MPAMIAIFGYSNVTPASLKSGRRRQRSGHHDIMACGELKLDELTTVPRIGMGPRGNSF